MNFFSRNIFDKHENTNEALNNPNLDKKSSDRLVLGFSLFHAKASNKKDGKFPVLFKNTFSDFDSNRFLDILDFIIDLSLSEKYKIILITQSQEQFNLAIDLFNKRNIDYRQEEQEGARLLNVE